MGLEKLSDADLLALRAGNLARVSDAGLMELRNSAAPKQKFKTDAAPIETGVPEWGRENPTLYGIAGAVRNVLAPAAEIGGMVIGGFAGAPVAGPAGSVAGAALGYGMGKQATRIADVALGNVQPSSIGDEAKNAALNVVEGANLEMGGQLLAPVIGAAVRGGATVAGKTADLVRDRGQLKAADILRQTIGSDIDAARRALSSAPQGVTSGQALAELNLPETQALIGRALQRDPKFLTNLMGQQDAARVMQLNAIARGSNQTAAKEAAAEMKQLLNAKLIPVLETELGAANTAGQLAPKLSAEATRLADAAASKVEDVRRFTASQNRAAPVLSASAQPVPPRYTYLGGDLAKRAEQVASQAAEGSLRFGEAARFKDAALQSLEAHGLRPLTTDAVVSKLTATATNPKFAGNRDVQAVLGRVADDLQAWTNSGGVIDAWALDSIRKNSVNSAVKALYPAAETKAQKELAAKVLTQVRPLIVDAIEAAGGTGYRGYLEAYTKGSQQIAQTKLGAEALRLYQSSPKKFIDLVEGNSPKAVEKIFGPGNYNLAKQMSDDAMKRLGGIAGELKRDTKIAMQATAGDEALLEMLKVNLREFQIPNPLNPKIAIANRALREFEKKVGKDVMVKLTQASKSPVSMKELLDTLPNAERNKVLFALRSFKPEMGKINESLTGYSYSLPDSQQNQ